MKKVFIAYCVWSLLLFAYGFYRFSDGRFFELAGETYKWFLVVFLAVSIGLIVLGGIFSWLAYSPHRKWASWCFIVFGEFRDEVQF
jgi:hypothetical protein